MMAREFTEEKLQKDLWIIDSGASIHISNSLDGMINLKNVSGQVIVGNSAIMDYNIVGDFKGKFQATDKFGNNFMKTAKIKM